MCGPFVFGAVCCRESYFAVEGVSACRNGSAVEGVFGGCRNVSAAGVRICRGRVGRCGRNFRSGADFFAHDIVFMYIFAAVRQTMT